MTNTSGSDSVHLGSRRIRGSLETYTRGEASASFIGECTACVRPQRVDNLTEVDVKHIKIKRPCVECGSPVLLERLYITMSGTACDGSCVAARGRNCTCACGGRNHGRGWRVDEVVTGETTASRVQKYRDEVRRKEEAAQARDRRRHEAKIEAFAPWLEEYWELVESITELKDWDNNIYGMWFRIHHEREALRQFEIDWFCSLLMEQATQRREKARLLEEKRRSSRYFGDPEQPISIPGVIIRLVWNQGYPRNYRLVVADCGDGVTVCFFSSRKWVWALEDGQRIQISGVVSKHREYEGIKQTQISHPSVEVLES